MNDIKVWIIPFISFSFFLSLLILSLIYTYSDIKIFAKTQQTSTQQLTNIQNFQEALGTKLK